MLNVFQLTKLIFLFCIETVKEQNILLKIRKSNIFNILKIEMQRE